MKYMYLPHFRRQVKQRIPILLSLKRIQERYLKMKDYIKAEQFSALLADIHRKLDQGEITECKEMLGQMLEDTKGQEAYIDRTYIGNLKRKKRCSRIEDINRMLEKMSFEQIDNVHKYTSDEYVEPNHEAEALEVIMSLSRKGRTEKQGQFDAE